MANLLSLKGPVSFTLPDGKEFILSAGNTYELPAENDYIRGLIEQGYLAPAPAVEEKPAKPIVHKKTDK